MPIDTAGRIAKQAIWLVGDPNGDYTTEAYWVTGLQIVQDDVVNSLLQNPNITRLKIAVVLQNVAAFTTDLRGYFDGTISKQLALLKEIVSMREKPAGGDPAQYQQMQEKNDLPVRTQVAYNSDFVWNGDTILLPGATQALDIRVWGVFEPQDITGKDTPVIPNARPALVWGLAAALAEGHGNENKVQRFNAKYEAAKFDLLNNIMMEMQFEETRQRPYGELSGTLE